MKAIILSSLITMAMTIVSENALAQQNKKAEKARENVAAAKAELKEAQTDSTEDYQRFKKNAEAKIADNQKRIAKLRAEKSKRNKDTEEEYNKKVSALEARNNELKERIEGCGHVKTSMWASFKREFTHDMNELRRSFKDIGDDDTYIDVDDVKYQ